MANFRTVCGNKAIDLNGSYHLYVHCMSKERLELEVEGMSCVELKCCELHVRFVDSLDIRRIALGRRQIMGEICTKPIPRHILVRGMLFA